MGGGQRSPATPSGSTNYRNSGGYGTSPENGRQLNAGDERRWGQQRNATRITSLNAELSRQSETLQRERNQSTRLRKEHSKLHDEHKELTEAHTHLETDRNYFKTKYEYVVRQLVRPYARHREIDFDDHTAGAIDFTLRPLLEDAIEAKDLKEQLQAFEGQTKSLQTHVQLLQKQMLAQVDKVLVMSDDQLSQNFRVLAALIKSLSRSIRVTEDMDVCVILEPRFLHTDVAEHHWASRARKKYYIEAWIWSVLLQNVFSTPFAYFRKSGPGLQSSWECLFGNDFFDEWPIPSSSSENWRCTSMEQLVDEVGRSTITQGEVKEENLPAESDHVQSLIRQVVQARKAVANTIGGQLATVSAKADLSRVPLIIDKAFSMAMEMSLQRSRLQVTCPFVGDQFAEEQMKCIPASDDEDVKRGTVAFIVNPGLAKWGDANGKNFEERHDIVPSLVHVERLDVKTECQDLEGMDFEGL
jgi:hypothetical protein